MPWSDDWAEYYDLIHEGLPGEAEFYVGNAVRIGGNALELGCGTGRIAIPMAMSGVRVTGLDISRPMLDVCEAKAAQVQPTKGRLTLAEGDMRDFRLDSRFDFIAMPYRTFMHLLTEEDQRSCLMCVHEHLAAKGVFIFNIWVPSENIIESFTGAKEGKTKSKIERFPLKERDASIVDHHSLWLDVPRQRMIEEHFVREIDQDGRVRRSAVLPMVRRWTTLGELGRLVALCGFVIEGLFGDFDCGPFTSGSMEMVAVLGKA